MSDNKPNDDNEDEHQAPVSEAAPETPAPMLDACKTAPETTLDVGKQIAEATLDARKQAAEATRKARKRSAAKARAVCVPATSYTVEAAAHLLSLDPTALRARLRRAQRAEGDRIVADLGGGISGFKLGKSWRLRFPER
jgi:hypothetical protein